MDEKSHEGWPLGSLEMDAGERLGCSHKKSLVDDLLEMSGRLIEGLNQGVFFAEACKGILDTDLRDHVADEGLSRLDVLTDFLDSRALTLNSLALHSSNMQVNLLLAKREEVARSNSDLSESEIMALKFLSPCDKDGRLFSGKLEEFAVARNKKEERVAVVQALTESRKRKNYWSGKDSEAKIAKFGESLNSGKKTFQDRRNKNFRGWQDRNSGKFEASEKTFGRGRGRFRGRGRGRGSGKEEKGPPESQTQ